MAGGGGGGGGGRRWLGLEVQATNKKENHFCTRIFFSPFHHC